MKKVAIAFTGAFLLAWAGTAYAEDYDVGTLRAIGQGRAVYLQNCAACHGPLAQGNDGVSTGTDGLTCAPTDLTTIRARDGRFDPLHVRVHIEGQPWGKCRPGMPCWQQAFRHTSGGDAYSMMQIHRLVKYLAWVQQEPRAAVPQ